MLFYFFFFFTWHAEQILSLEKSLPFLILWATMYFLTRRHLSSWRLLTWELPPAQEHLAAPLGRGTATQAMCNHCYQGGAACRFLCYNELAAFMLWLGDLCITMLPGGQSLSAAQHMPGLTAAWITYLWVYNGLLVMIIIFHPLIHIKFTFVKSITQYRQYYLSIQLIGSFMTDWDISVT